MDIALTRIRATPMMARPTRAAFHLHGNLLKNTFTFPHFRFLQRYDKPAHFVAKGAKEIGADEVGDGSGEERCSKLPLVTEAIIMIRISLDSNCM